LHSNSNKKLEVVEMRWRRRLVVVIIHHYLIIILILSLQALSLVAGMVVAPMLVLPQMTVHPAQLTPVLGRDAKLIEDRIALCSA
jgi:polyferredoxin